LRCRELITKDACDNNGNGGRSDDCFWLYEKNLNEGDDGGICKDKEDEFLECSLVKRENQCNDEFLSGTFLENKCIYEEGEGGCKWRCEEIQEDNKCSGSGTGERGNDCTWIYSNISESNYSGNCYPKNKTDIECNTIIRETQCESGGGFNKLKDDNECTFIEDGNGGTCERKV
jgi:hypothetical protein